MKRVNKKLFIIKKVRKELPPPRRIIPDGKQRLINLWFEKKGEER